MKTASPIAIRGPGSGIHLLSRSSKIYVSYACVVVLNLKILIVGDGPTWMGGRIMLLLSRTLGTRLDLIEKSRAMGWHSLCRTSPVKVRILLSEPGIKTK